MFSIVLFQPEIPPNTGNIIRLCANTGCRLNLIKPLGFDLEAKQLRRAGLDYHEYASVKSWENWEAFMDSTKETDGLLGNHPGDQGEGLVPRLVSLSTKNAQVYSDYQFQPGDYLVFGSETSGLPQSVRDSIDPANRLTIPMFRDSRSLNLSNSVAIVVYEALRQQGFVSLK